MEEIKADEKIIRAPHKITYKRKKTNEIITKVYDQKEYNDKYYKANREKLLEKVKCECGREYTKALKSRHVKSKEHLSKSI